MSAPQPTYISSSGHLTTPALTRRVHNSLRDYASIAYLFFETLVAPILNPRSTVPPGQRPNGNRRGGGGPADRGLDGSWGGSGGGGRNGGGGFMSMTDMRGGKTVNTCGGASCD